MTALISIDPDSLANAARDVGAIIKCVPGLFNALYETMGYYWTDPIKRKRRIKNLEAEFKMAEEMIKGKKRLEDISAALAKEVLEPAMEEDREELQKLWAALIARCLTSEYNGITRTVIDAVKQFEPIDALVLQSSESIAQRISVRTLYDKVRSHFDNGCPYTTNDITESCERLYDLKCFDYEMKINAPTGRFMPERVLQLTYFGENVLKAVTPPTESASE